MVFKIPDYVEIVSEISSEWTAICPCCKKPKLKIRKENNAYICVNTPSCTTEQIRFKLGQKKYEGVKYIPYLEPLAISNVSDNLKIGKTPDNISFPLKEDNKTIYNYNSFFKIERIDISKKKKGFYPYYKINNEWIKSSEIDKEIKDTLSSFYREDLLSSDELTFVVEGEKCVDFVMQNLKIKCTTPPGFGWNERWLRLKLPKLKTSGIIILPDHDKVGIDKSYTFQRVAWELKIPCSVIFIYDILNQEKDIADINTKDLQIIKEKMRKWI